MPVSTLNPNVGCRSNNLRQCFPNEIWLLIADFVGVDSEAHRQLQIANAHPFSNVGQAVITRSPTCPQPTEKNPWTFKLHSKHDWAPLSAWSRVFTAQAVDELQVSFLGDSPASDLADFVNLLQFLSKAKATIHSIVVYIECSEAVTPKEYQEFKSAVQESGIRRLHLQNTALSESFHLGADEVGSFHCLLNLFYCYHDPYSTPQPLLGFADSVISLSLECSCRGHCYSSDFDYRPDMYFNPGPLYLPETLLFPLLQTLKIKESTFSMDVLHSVISRAPRITYLQVGPHNGTPFTVSKPAATAPPFNFFLETLSATASYATKFLEGFTKSTTISRFLLIEEKTHSSPDLDFLQHINIKSLTLPAPSSGNYFTASDLASLSTVEFLSLGTTKHSYDTKELMVRSHPFVLVIPTDIDSGHYTPLSPYIPSTISSLFGLGPGGRE